MALMRHLSPRYLSTKIMPTDPRWISTLDAITAELVSSRSGNRDAPGHRESDRRIGCAR